MLEKKAQSGKTKALGTQRQAVAVRQLGVVQQWQWQRALASPGRWARAGARTSPKMMAGLDCQATPPKKPCRGQRVLGLENSRECRSSGLLGTKPRQDLPRAACLPTTPNTQPGLAQRQTAG